LFLAELEGGFKLKNKEMTLQTLILKAHATGNSIVASYLENLLSEERQSIVIESDDKYLNENGITKFLKDNTFCHTWPEGNIFQAFFEPDLEETLLEIKLKLKSK